MKWKRERGRLASGDSCFGARPKVPMESHEGDGEADEVRFFGKQEQMSCRKKEGLRERSLSNYPKNVGEIGAEGGWFGGLLAEVEVVSTVCLLFPLRQ